MSQTLMSHMTTQYLQINKCSKIIRCRFIGRTIRFIQTYCKQHHNLCVRAVISNAPQIFVQEPNQILFAQIFVCYTLNLIPWILLSIYINYRLLILIFMCNCVSLQCNNNHSVEVNFSSKFRPISRGTCQYNREAVGYISTYIKSSQTSNPISRGTGNCIHSPMKLHSII